MLRRRFEKLSSVVILSVCIDNGVGDTDISLPFLDQERIIMITSGQRNLMKFRITGSDVRPWPVRF